MPAKKATQKVVAKAVKKASKVAPAKKATEKTAKKSAKVSEVNTKSVETAKKALVAAKKEKVAKDAPAPTIVATGLLAQKWTSLFKKSDAIEAKPYNMKSIYNEKTAIVHKVLGWGYILANRNDRLEVLFKDGIKYLISNYK